MAVVFDGMPPHYDMLYLRVAGTKETLSMPLNESFTDTDSITYDWRQSNKDMFVFYEDKKDGRQFKLTRQEFLDKLTQDIYTRQFKVVDVAIHPNGEMQPIEVTRILNVT